MGSLVCYWDSLCRRYDSQIDKYYYRARYYDADTGRFLSPDPIGYYDSMNLYQYVTNNPLNWIDPWGLKGDPMNANSALAEGFPLPEAWSPNWDWVPTPNNKRPGYFKDPGGNTWSPHPEDKRHNPHWDKILPGRKGQKK